MYYAFENKSIFDYSSSETFSSKERKKKIYEIGGKVDDFFFTTAIKRGYEEREGQQEMAFDILDALKENKHIVIEAGVGIGKSFAYIVPILYFHKYYKKPIVISTSTITLQEQLVDDVKEICDIIHYPVEILLAKGQTHFICNKRADENKTKISHSTFSEIDKKNIYEKSDFTHAIGDYEWNLINVKNYNYNICKNKCPYTNQCKYYLLRLKMKNTSGIIICNQDLLTNHLHKVDKEQNGLLSDGLSLIVIDESHNLEDKVRNSLTKSYTRGQIVDTCYQASQAMDRIGVDRGKLLNKLGKHLDILFEQFESQIKHQINENRKNMEDAERFFLVMSHPVQRSVNNVYLSIKDISDAVTMFSDDVLQSRESTKNAIEELDDMYDFFRKINNYHKDKELFWLEKISSITLFGCPTNINEVVDELYFKKHYRVIMTSATITTSKTGNNDEMYSYFVKNTNFPIDSSRGILADPKPSPFPYNKHAMIYYNNSLPHPTNERKMFIKEGTNILIKLLEITMGKALILFTSKVDLEMVYDELKNSNPPFTIYKQQPGSSQKETLKVFKDDINSVLLGTGAYWEGISIEGRSLSNVVIFRLPFPVPDPIIEFKRSRAKDPLMDVNVPEMIIKLNQGIGRLIRNYTDKGIICIIDPRLGDSSLVPYKDLVWDSLPIKNKTNDLVKLKKFYLDLMKIS